MSRIILPKSRGLRVISPLGEFEVRPKVTDDPAQVGAVNVVLLTLKAHSLAEIAPRLAPLLGPETSIVSAQNGIPWWYFYRHGGEWEGAHLESVDPGGIIAKNVDPRRLIGCVIYCSTAIAEAGVIEHIEGTRFAIGEPDGAKSERCRRIAEVFIRAGLRCPIRSDIRHDIWVKLMGSVAFNPISALSRASLIEIVRCRETRLIAHEVMAEAQEVAKRLGINIGISIERRMAGAEKIGHHKTSMLQDVEMGRSLELEPIIGAVLELGSLMNLSMPHTMTLYACAKMLSQNLGNKTGASS